MGTRERRVNVGRQISSFQRPPPPPPAPQERLSNTESAEPLQSCTLKSNDWVRQFIAKKICLDQGETTELFGALWHARHVISVHLLYFVTPSPLTPWFKWSVVTLRKTQTFAPTKFHPKCWCNVRRMNKDNLLYVFSVVSCVFLAFSRLKLYSFFIHHINIWNQKVQTSVFYEEFLPITWIKPRPGVRNTCRAWHHDASNISDGPPVLGCTLHYCL